MTVITVRPGETITVIGLAADIQPPLGIWGPTDPRPTHPIAGPGRPRIGAWPTIPAIHRHGHRCLEMVANRLVSGVRTIRGQPTRSANPGNPAWPGGAPRPDQGLPPFPNHPIVIPPTEPPPVEPPTDGDDGNWVWAWSPQAGRWVWVKVPGEGEAGPKE